MRNSWPLPANLWSSVSPCMVLVQKPQCRFGVQGAREMPGRSGGARSVPTIVASTLQLHKPEPAALELHTLPPAVGWPHANGVRERARLVRDTTLQGPRGCLA
jgi:hypothetical protein